MSCPSCAGLVAAGVHAVFAAALAAAEKDDVLQLAQPKNFKDVCRAARAAQAQATVEDQITTSYIMTLVMERVPPARQGAEFDRLLFNWCGAKRFVQSSPPSTLCGTSWSACPLRAKVCNLPCLGHGQFLRLLQIFISFLPTFSEWHACSDQGAEPTRCKHRG